MERLRTNPHRVRNERHLYRDCGETRGFTTVEITESLRGFINSQFPIPKRKRGDRNKCWICRTEVDKWLWLWDDKIVRITCANPACFPNIEDINVELPDMIEYRVTRSRKSGLYDTASDIQ